MQAAVIDDVVRAIDAACANYLASGEVDPTPWLDDISNHLMDVAARHSRGVDDLFSTVREKLRSDLSAAKAYGPPAKAVFIEAAASRVDDLAQPFPPVDGSDLGPTFKRY